MGLRTWIKKKVEERRKTKVYKTIRKHVWHDAFKHEPMAYGIKNVIKEVFEHSCETEKDWNKFPREKFEILFNALCKYSPEKYLEVREEKEDYLMWRMSPAVWSKNFTREQIENFEKIHAEAQKKQKELENQ